MKIVVVTIWSAACACSVAPLVGWNRYVFEVKLRLNQLTGENNMNVGSKIEFNFIYCNYGKIFGIKVLDYS